MSTHENLYNFLIPMPREIKITRDKYTFDNIIEIFINRNTYAELELNFRKLINLLKDKNIRIKISIINLPDWCFNLGEGDYKVIKSKNVLPKDGYKIVIKDNRINILADDKQGCFYAIQTLVQIIKLNKEIPCVEIIDYPEYSMRGFQLDLGRQMENMRTIENMIETMAHYKMNQVYLYIENGFKYKCCKEVISRDALTADNLKHIINFAKERCMEVIPSLELFSHMEWLLIHPKYKFLSEYRDKKVLRRQFAGDYVICPSLSESWKLIESMIDEWIPIIDTSYLHVGLDEVWMIGCCDKCKTIREKFGEGQIFLNHILKLYKLLKKKGKRMMMWADMLFYWQDILEEIPKDIIMVDWYYEPIPDKTKIAFLNWRNISTTEILRKYGFDVIVAPCTEIQNIYTFRKYAEKYNVKGFCITQWEYSNGFITECIQGNVYGAECSWTYYPRPPEVFSKYFGRNFFGFGIGDLNLETLFTLLPNKYCFQPDEKYTFENILKYRIDSTNNEFTRKYSLIFNITDEMLKKHKVLPNKEILYVFKLNASRWLSLGLLDRIINEIALSIREILKDRNNTELLFKLGLQTKELEEINKLIKENYCLAKKLWNVYRNNIKPKGNFPESILMVSKSIAELIIKLKKFIVKSVVRNVPFKNNLLIIDFMFPEANNFNFFIKISEDGEKFDKIYSGGVYELLFPQTWYQAKTITKVFKLNNRLPKFIKISSDGFTQFGIETIKVVNILEEKMPSEIVKSEGNVYFQNNLLYDDTRFTLFNKQGVADIFYNPEKTKENYIILTF